MQVLELTLVQYCRIVQHCNTMFVEETRVLWLFFPIVMFQLRSIHTLALVAVCRSLERMSWTAAYPSHGSGRKESLVCPAVRSESGRVLSFYFRDLRQSTVSFSSSKLLDGTEY